MGHVHLKSTCYITPSLFDIFHSGVRKLPLSLVSFLKELQHFPALIPVYDAVEGPQHVEFIWTGEL